MFDHSFSFDCQDKVILVVEDDYDIGDIIENYLKREGMSVIRAMNGKQAIELHASQPIDLILLDIKLPELNGWEVLNKIRQKAQTPVIMLTALDQDIDKVMALRIGADDFVVKPFNPNEVIARVQAVLRRTQFANKVTNKNKLYKNIEIDTDTHSVIYNYAIEKGWISLSSFQQEDWTSFHFVDWIWLATVIFCGCIISLVIGMRLAKRFIVPINFLAEAAKKISHGDLSARAYDNRIHSAEMSELLYNFNDMAQKLEVSVKNAQVWNAAIAHELRTPITILQGRLQGIIDGVFKPDEVLFKSLLNQVEVLSHLVEDLRTLSLVENQQLRLNYELFDFKAVVEKVLKAFEDRLDQAKLVPELDLTSTPVYCDRRRIEQVLIALIDNAIRYSHAGKLKISSEVVSQNWILKIEDEGPGIATEFQDDLFKPFFRLEESRNKEFGGTGLGLAVVHAIIVALKGTIQYSNQGSKSIFTIKISMNN